MSDDNQVTGVVWWHKVGQHIICKFADNTKEGFPALTEKMMYIISGVTADCGQPHFALEEIPEISPKTDQPYRYKASRFRPVTDISISSLQELLSPTPDEIDKVKKEDEADAPPVRKEKVREPEKVE